MPELHDAALLRIYIGDDDTYDERPLPEAIVKAARDAGLAGATVLRGNFGFGRSAHVHDIHKGFSHDLPVIVEIVDEFAAIEAWLPVLEDMKIATRRYRRRRARAHRAVPPEELNESRHPASATAVPAAAFCQARSAPREGLPMASLNAHWATPVK